MTNTTNETTSRTSDSEAAAWGASLSTSAKITMLAIWTLPTISSRDPISPTERAKASAAPDRIAGRSAGSITRRNVTALDAPSEAAASSTSRSSSSSTGCTARTENGSVTNSSAITTATRV